MGKRFQKRNKAVLPVKVTGVDTAGREFTVFGHTLDFSAYGARLGKIQANVKCGDEISIHYRNAKLRFLVRWIGPADSAVQGQLGVECLEPGKNLWPLESQPQLDGVDDFQPSEQVSGSSAGRDARYPCKGVVEVRPSRGQKGFSARISDISADGCHVLVSAGLPIGTAVSLLLRVDAAEIEATGVVRSVFPGHGMGILFTHLASAADRDRLKLLIQRLQSSHTMSVAGFHTPSPSASD